MKKFLKSLFAILLIGVVSISLTGCGNKNNDTEDTMKQVENENTKNNGNDKNTSNEYDDINLYSDDTKIVFNMQDSYYIVYYHNGNDITGLEFVYDYKDVDTAKLAGAAIKAWYVDDEDVKSAEIKGTKLRVVFKEVAYEGETLESVKQTYSFLEEVKKN